MATTERDYYELLGVARTASADEIKALVAQSQKRSAVYDVITNPTTVVVDVV